MYLPYNNSFVQRLHSYRIFPVTYRITAKHSHTIGISALKIRHAENGTRNTKRQQQGEFTGTPSEANRMPLQSAPMQSSAHIAVLITPADRINTALNEFACARGTAVIFTYISGNHAAFIYVYTDRYIHSTAPVPSRRLRTRIPPQNTATPPKPPSAETLRQLWTS